MSDLNNMTIAEIVKNNVRAGAIFERYNLDFCCKGNRTIDDACNEKNIDSNALKTELGNLDTFGSNAVGVEDWPLEFMTDYIVNTHHNYIRKMIPVISGHAIKCAQVHGNNHPELIDVNRIFSVVYKDLKQHMMKEEEILFPHIKYLSKLDKNGGNYESPYFGSVVNPIELMEKEHQSAGDELYMIRKLTNNYSAPEDACNTYRALYSELKDFEEDLHKHVHLENYTLFPKAISLEKEMNMKKAI